MNPASFTVIDDFCPSVDAVRESALASGFGTWRPNKGLVGSSIYEGMSFHGRHADMIRALSNHLGHAIFPNSMFFRVTNKDTEKAYIHSDRHDGDFTCVAYLSKHEEPSGTAFYRHRPTGLIEMPTMENQMAQGIDTMLATDMVSGLDRDWEQLDVVRGLYNRALVFSAPLFHSRYPQHGFGSSDTEGRMVWVCHYTIQL